MGAEGMHYATLDLDGRTVGGIGEIGADMPAEHACVLGHLFRRGRHRRRRGRRLTELGGSVVAPAWDSPYGRMAVVSDDQGAVRLRADVVNGAVSPACPVGLGHGWLLGTLAGRHLPGPLRAARRHAAGSRCGWRSRAPRCR